MDKRFTESYIEELAHKYKTGTLTPEEQADFDAWYQSHDDTESTHTNARDPQQIKDRILANILAKTNSIQKRNITALWPRIAAAASILLILSAGGYFLLHKSQPQQTAQNQIHDIAPGGNKAILTLANGAKISLTDAKIGAVANRGSVAVTKTADGDVVYNASSSETINSKSKIKYDTLTIPRGGQYHLTMSDGTRVWLNAATQIRYPENFTGKERNIQLIYGEADFEVKHNASKLFSVLVKGQTIEDIGTNFNINAYDDEPVIKTTLLEGNISLTKGKHKSILKPGQQAITQQNNDGINVHDVDTEEATAWKNGYFLFNDEDLQSVMRKVSRWYNVDIVYPDYKLTEIYGGSVTRYGNVSKVLDFLEKTGHVRYKIEGKKIIIQKK